MLSFIFIGGQTGAIYIAEEVVVGIVASELVKEFLAPPQSIIHIRFGYLEEKVKPFSIHLHLGEGLQNGGILLYLGDQSLCNGTGRSRPHILLAMPEEVRHSFAIEAGDRTPELRVRTIGSPEVGIVPEETRVL